MVIVTDESPAMGCAPSVNCVSVSPSHAPLNATVGVEEMVPIESIVTPDGARKTSSRSKVSSVKEPFVTTIS